MKVVVVKNWKVAEYHYAPEHFEAVVKFYTNESLKGEIQSFQIVA